MSIASCTQHNPDWWFPVEVAGYVKWSRTPEAMMARKICASCPVLESCRDYSLRWDLISGIWAGLDRHERYELQKKLRITPESFSASYRSHMLVLQPSGDSNE